MGGLRVEKIYMIDTIGPFFTGIKKKKLNWSKIPFYYLEKQDLSQKKIQKIVGYFKIFIEKAKDMGYNAVSVDELCYMVDFDFYDPDLKKKIQRYRELYNEIFKIAVESQMKIFVTTDIMFYNDSIESYLKNTKITETELLMEGIIRLFDFFPMVEGVIFRIGESDGVETIGKFKSKIFLKRKKQANSFIKKLLLIFEERSKYLIFRTWTVGAYEVGDLMWNEKTYGDVFRGIDSENFIISMKFGDADFFRYLNLNSQFFVDGKKKIIELQTRREYEGFGEFPSFVGWDYQDYYEKIKQNSSLVGITVWCQTGGWSNFKNLTFIKESSFWNELNTYTTVQIFKNGKSVEEAVGEFVPTVSRDRMMEFLKISDEVIKELLYDPNYSRLKLYFNKVRVPTVIHIFWNNVTITDFTVAFYRNFCQDPESSIEIGYKALKKIDKLNRIARENEIDCYDYAFHYDTFYLLLKSRELIYFDLNRECIKEFKTMVKKYRSDYPYAYRFRVKLSKKKKNKIFLPLIRLLVRRKKEYRLQDKILFNKFTSPIYLSIYKTAKKKFPKFLDNQGMPFETLFK